MEEWKNRQAFFLHQWAKIHEYSCVDGVTMSKSELTDMLRKNKKGVRIFDENPFIIYWVNAGKKVVVHYDWDAMDMWNLGADVNGLIHMYIDFLPLEVVEPYIPLLDPQTQQHAYIPLSDPQTQQHVNDIPLPATQFHSESSDDIPLNTSGELLLDGQVGVDDEPYDLPKRKYNFEFMDLPEEVLDNLPKKPKANEVSQIFPLDMPIPHSPQMHALETTQIPTSEMPTNVDPSYKVRNWGVIDDIDLEERYLSGNSSEGIDVSDFDGAPPTNIYNSYVEETENVYKNDLEDIHCNLGQVDMKIAPLTINSEWRDIQECRNYFKQ